MKKGCFLFLISLFISSCGKPELTKDEAVKIVSQYYHLPFQTRIAIDKIYEDYGWPPQKYKQLHDRGLVYLNELRSGIFVKKFAISLTEEGGKYWLIDGTMEDPVDGKIRLIIFKGYSIDIKDANISSNANENKAEAEVILKISDISPIQEVFSPIETTEIKRIINFKLFDDGWKIVEDENSKNLIEPIVVPLHWASGGRITYDNVQ